MAAAITPAGLASSFCAVLPAWWPDTAQGAHFESPFRHPGLEETRQRLGPCMAAESHTPTSGQASAYLGTTGRPAADLNITEAALIGCAGGSRDTPRAPRRPAWAWGTRSAAARGAGGRHPPVCPLAGRAGATGSRPRPASLELLLPLAVVGEAESSFHTQKG